MPTLTRSISLTILRYGLYPAAESPSLFEVAMRVDASCNVQANSLDVFSEALAIVRQRLGAWLQQTWGERLLLAETDEAAAAYAAKNARTLARPPVRLPCAPDAKHLAKLLFSEVCPRLFALTDASLRITRLQVTLDPGDSFIVQDAAAGSLAGGPPCTTQAIDSFESWTQHSSKAKFALVKKANKPSGGAS